MNYRTHRSVRQYTSQPIEENVLLSILESAIRASNTGNMQTYSIIVTQDQARKDALAPYHFNQPMVSSAAVVLTFCVDFNRFTHWCRVSGCDVSYDNFMSLYVGTIDAMLAAQNAAVAAEDKGLGICYLGTALYNMQGIVELLKLPKGVVPVTTITMGYPVDLPPLSERLPLDAVVHNEEYHEFTDQEIQRLHREIESMEKNRRMVRENGMNNLAQLICEKRFSAKDYQQLSDQILTTLRAQGYSL